MTFEGIDEAVDSKGQEKRGLPRKIYLIAASEIHPAGRLSWQFIFEAGIPADVLQEITQLVPFYYGYLKFIPSMRGGFDPKKWAEAKLLEAEGRLEDAAAIKFIEDGGVVNFDYNLFQVGGCSGFVGGISINDTPLSAGLVKANPEIPLDEKDPLALVLKEASNNSVILVDSILTERIQRVCGRLGIELVVFRSEGTIFTN